MMLSRSRTAVLILVSLSIIACDNKPKKKNSTTDRQVSGAAHERDQQNQSFQPQDQLSPNQGYQPPAPQRFAHVPLRVNGIIQYKQYNKEQLAMEDVNRWVESFKQTDLYGQGKWKFLYIPSAYIKSQQDLNWARIGLSKAINMVAPAAKKIHSPVDISEGYGLVYAIDISKYWGDRADHKWSTVANSRYTRGFSAASEYRLKRFNEQDPVAADRFAYNALHSWNYNELIDHPYFRQPGNPAPSLRGSLGGLFNKLLDRDGNEQAIPRNPESAKGLNRFAPGEVTHRFAVNNAITFGPRFVQRRQLKNWSGSLYESFDDFEGTVRELPWTGENYKPRDYGSGMMKQFGTTTSEAWAHMENGLPAFMLFGNGAQERSTAEYSTVVDPLNVYGDNSQRTKTKHGKLVNGFCTFCHYQAVQHASNDMYAAIQNGVFKDNPEKQEAALKYWSSDVSLQTLYGQDSKIYQEALAEIVYGIGSGDPKWLNDIVNGVIEREPIYYLVADIMGLKDRGNVEGKRFGKAPGEGFDSRFNQGRENQ